MLRYDVLFCIVKKIISNILIIKLRYPKNKVKIKKKKDVPYASAIWSLCMSL